MFHYYSLVLIPKSKRTRGGTKRGVFQYAKSFYGARKRLKVREIRKTCAPHVTHTGGLKGLKFGFGKDDMEGFTERRGGARFEEIRKTSLQLRYNLLLKYANVTSHT